MYSLYLLLFLVDSKESGFSPRVPAPEYSQYTARVFAVSSLVFGGQQRKWLLSARPRNRVHGACIRCNLLLLLVDSKESGFSPRVPTPEYTARVFAVSSLVFGGQ